MLVAPGETLSVSVLAAYSGNPVVFSGVYLTVNTSTGVTTGPFSATMTLPGAATTVVLAAPPSGSAYLVTEVVILNQDGNAHQIQTFKNLGATAMQVAGSILQTGWSLNHANGSWYLLDQLGQLLNLQGGPSSVFGAAGAGHRAGAVADPGATAHPNFPWVLRDDAVWHPPIGIIGIQVVEADESTSSSANVTLPTAETVSFTLDVAGNVLVRYYANTYNTSAGFNSFNDLYLDGVLLGATTDNVIGAAAANSPVPCVATAYVTAVGSGAHTVSVQHRAVGGTAHWRGRRLTVELTP
jgi:hypothetical protein